jgi:hypothetical protein
MRYWRAGAVVVLVTLVLAVVVPKLLRRGSYFGISPWAVGGIGLGVVVVGGATLIYTLRAARVLRELVAWAQSSVPHSTVHVIEATRSLRGLVERGNTHPRFWVMAVGPGVIVMWSEARRAPAVVVPRSNIRRASVERVDFQTHRGSGLHIELHDPPDSFDFGLYRMPRKIMLYTPSRNQAQAVADGLAAPTQARPGPGRRDGPPSSAGDA